MVFQLRENETIQTIKKKHPITYFWSIILGLIFFLPPFFLMVPLWRWGKWGYGIFSVLIIVGAFFLIRALINYYANFLIITNQRLILVERKGFLKKKIIKIGYEQVRAVEVSVEGIFQTIFCCGSVWVKLIESQEGMIINNLTKPTNVQELILNLKDKFEEKDQENWLDQMGYRQLIALAWDLRVKLGRAKFREIAEE